MRKYKPISVWLVMILHISNLLAQKGQLTLSTGLLIEMNTLEWSIAGNINGQEPNVLSELIFRDITSLGSYADITYKPSRTLKLFSSYHNSGVIDGRGSDADYRNDNRQNPTYHEPFISNKGSMKTFSAGINFDLIHKKDFHLDGVVSYTKPHYLFYILSPDIDDLKSTYEVEWKDVKLAFGGTYNLSAEISAGATLYHCFSSYRANGNWNLRNEFMHPVSFKQHSRGYKTGGAIDVDWKLSTLLVLYVAGTLEKAKVFKGLDTSFLKNSEQVLTQFNEANNSFYALKIGIQVSLFNGVN